jgi:hypothetical protein
MKKIIIALFFLVSTLGFTNVNAQQKKPATTTVKAKDSTKTPGMKKNGTPDMRYKANKDAKADTTVHKKKNGTPDMRYKENKDKK